MSENLRKNVVRAVGASTLGTLLAKIISLASTLVLARLLMPEDYGLMAMASTVTGFIGFFNEIGLGAAIIQKQDLKKEEASSCFGIALIASSLLTLVIAGISWPAATFFNMPQLQNLLCVLGLGFVFGALNTVPLALLRKELRFQTVLWLGVCNSIVQSMVAIPLASLGYGYWSIVGGFFAAQFVTTVWYWSASKWRPAWPLNVRQGLPLLGYGASITSTRLLWHAYMNADKLIIGKILGEGAVGLYDVSRSLASLPTSQISGLVTNIATPVFAKLQNDVRQLSAAHLRMTRGVACITFPLLAGMAVLAGELIDVVLGSKWHDAVRPLQALCLSEMVVSISSLQSQVLIATDRVKQLVRYNILCAMVLPFSMGLGAYFSGLVGTAVAWSLTYPILAGWLFKQACHATKQPMSSLWSALNQVLAGTALMAGAVFLLLQLLDANDYNSGSKLFAGVGLGVFIYLSYIVYVDRAGLKEIHQVLCDLGVPRRKLDRWPFSRIDKGFKENT
ncbi:lipopolysaccharide biosynthesis protein [Paucibacter sp. AS339]|uniref:lipopolysaccharide biosynthesis protein n=1 Tax=Paucibacter hankyongi TaxID=3133434 RepID=UPI0030ADFB24